jgi:hypothetical protein
MKNSQKFIAFLESLQNDSNTELIGAVKQAFTLTEASVRGLSFPDVRSPERMRAPSKASKPLTAEEQAARSAELKRKGALAKQAAGRINGPMSQLAKYATVAPLDVEKWMNEVLKPAIKAGKLDMDSRFGTDSAKTGILQRVKNAGKAMMGEGVEEMEVDEDLTDVAVEDDEDENDIGGFISSKFQKRDANLRRASNNPNNKY